jgi:hypothetical protein
LIALRSFIALELKLRDGNHAIEVTLDCPNDDVVDGDLARVCLALDALV